MPTELRENTFLKIGLKIKIWITQKKTYHTCEGSNRTCATYESDKCLKKSFLKRKVLEWVRSFWQITISVYWPLLSSLKGLIFRDLSNHSISVSYSRKKCKTKKLEKNFPLKIPVISHRYFSKVEIVITWPNYGNFWETCLGLKHYVHNCD